VSFQTIFQIVSYSETSYYILLIRIPSLIRLATRQLARHRNENAKKEKKRNKHWNPFE